MTEEFNLSEKIIKDSRHREYDVDILKVEDVKEFIKRLKDIVEEEKGISPNAYMRLEEGIDELAGEKLT